MKRRPALAHLALALAFLFGAAFSCGQNNNRRSSTYTQSDEGAPTSTTNTEAPARTGSDLPEMTGGWLVISQTTRGEREDPSQPSFGCIAFRNGIWNYGHNGGSAEGGTYRISGDRLIMTGDDGRVAYDLRLSSRSGGDLWMQWGDDVLHLRFKDSTGCGL